MRGRRGRLASGIVVYKRPGLVGWPVSRRERDKISFVISLEKVGGVEKNMSGNIY